MVEKTKDVEVLLGNPRKAILAMSIPLIIAMVVQNVNNLADAAWVASLGENAMAAVGYVFPLFFILISIGNGIGIGSSSAIARFIGMGDKESADRTAAQAFVLTIISSIAIGVILSLLTPTIFKLMGVTTAYDDCVSYGIPIFLGAPILLLNGVMSNLLRSEGASKKSMYSQILAAVINIILDPFFIYDFGLGLGIMGAALATILAMSISLSLLIYWYFFSNTTYLKIKLKKFRFDLKLDKAILRVGFPASMEMIIISAISMISNSIVQGIGGDTSVAVFSSTWRLVNVAMIPIMGMGSAVVPVCAAAFGQRRYEKIKEAYKFSIMVITTIMFVVCGIILVASEYIVVLFTYADNVVHLRTEMAEGLRLCCLFLIFVPWGFVSDGFFQSLGMGSRSLICAVIRNFLSIPFCIAMASVFGTMFMFWIGMASAEIIGTFITGGLGIYTLRNLMKGKYQPSEEKDVV